MCISEGAQRQTILWNILRTEYEEIYSQGRPLVDSLEFLRRCHPLTYTMVSFIYCHLHHGYFVIHHINVVSYSHYVRFCSPFTYHNGMFYWFTYTPIIWCVYSFLSPLCLTEYSSLALCIVDFNIKVSNVTASFNLQITLGPSHQLSSMSFYFISLRDIFFLRDDIVLHRPITWYIHVHFIHYTYLCCNLNYDSFHAACCRAHLIAMSMYTYITWGLMNCIRSIMGMYLSCP